MNFADTLIYLRKRAGMTQEELAAKIGISRSAVGMIESGQRMPGREALESIADTFNVSTDFLIGRSSAGEHSRTFLDNLAEIINNADNEDVAAAGISRYELDRIIDGTIPLSFEVACEIADALGYTVDEIMNEKDPALMKENEVAIEITELLSVLPENKLDAAREYIRWLSETAGT